MKQCCHKGNNKKGMKRISPKIPVSIKRKEREQGKKRVDTGSKKQEKKNYEYVKIS